MSIFNVGDRIVMKGSNWYVYTQLGSTGVVIELGSDQILVDFDYLSGGIPPSGTTRFWVDIGDCEILQQTSPQERVCAKIKQMEERWKKFQTSKRDCHV